MNIDTSKDILDGLDIQDEIDELESSIAELKDTIDDLQDNLNHTENEKEINEIESEIEALEADIAEYESDLEDLQNVADDCGKYLSDYQFINDDYFAEYAEDLARDTTPGDFNSWPLNCIDWKLIIDDLQMDYTSVEICGSTFWYLA